MSDFVKTMHDWRRMCNAFSKVNDGYCCRHCPFEHMKGCGVILGIEDGSYGNIAETVDAWAAENPEPQYPTWQEWLTEQGVISAGGLWNKAFAPIPADIAEKLGLKPKGGNGND